MALAIEEPRKRKTNAAITTRKVVKVQRAAAFSDKSSIRISLSDARKISALIENPPKPNKRLKEAVMRFKGSVCA